MPKKCQHRKTRTVGVGEAGFIIECLDCNIRTRGRPSPTEAFLHRRGDLSDAAAERAAIEAKGARA
jgi:hypothetical protein